MSPAPTAADRREVAFVLHTHLPYVRNHGVWPVGEEWLFQVWAASWLPVTRLLERLADAGRRQVLTLGVSPMVAHQVADRRLAADLGTWLGGQAWRAEEQRWHHLLPDDVRELSSFHWRRFDRLLAYHLDVERRGGLLAVWADLARAEVIELLGGPATHAYLPLQADAALLDAQLAVGLDAHERWAGSRPRGIWPPELAYRPAGPVDDPTGGRAPVGVELDGLEAFYAARGIEHVVVDRPALARPEHTTLARRDLLGDGVLIGDSDVAAYGRDAEVTAHVWSPTAGYPGNVWYRDSHALGGHGIHPSWRVTDRALPPDAKAAYEPAAATTQVARDADHFLGVLHDRLDPRPGTLTVAAFDTELFGHWWFEGVDWLGAVLDRIAADPGLATTTLASRRDRRPPAYRTPLSESSWGEGHRHAAWVAPATYDLWATVRTAELRARAALRGGRGTSRQRAQVARELALLSASDWPFLVVRDTAADYARARVDQHAQALDALCDTIHHAAPDGDDHAAPDGDLVAEALAARDDAPAEVGPIVAALDPVTDLGRG